MRARFGLIALVFFFLLSSCIVMLQNTSVAFSATPTPGLSSATTAVPQSPTGNAVRASIAEAPVLSNAQLLDRYVHDKAALIKNPFLDQIIAACQELETQMRIRILIRTEILDDLAQYDTRVETFFAEWIRSIGPEKRGILLYAALPKDSLHGKFNLRVGIGLKYLITREMGENILHRVILPNNADNRDGKGFLEGVLAVKRMLLDELRREETRRGVPMGAFDPLDFLWSSKRIVLALFVGLFLCYVVFFVERCPRCNGSLRTRFEILKEAGINTLGLRRRIYACDRCGFSRRKKEPIFPNGWAGWWMWLTGTRRNIRIASGSSSMPVDLSSDDRHKPSP